jgi:transcriptional regulator with XRE-family HTH domain
MRALGLKIAAARENAGLSQDDIAARADVSRPHVSRLERGLVTSPDVRSLVAVAEAVGLHPNDLRFADCDAAEAAAAALEYRQELAAVAEREISLGDLVDVASAMTDGQPLRIVRRNGQLYVAALRSADTATEHQGSAQQSERTGQ